jgi:hypothetical protein
LLQSITKFEKEAPEREDKSPIELIWQHRIPGGCIASAVVTDGIMAHLGARTDPGGMWMARDSQEF